MTKVAPAFFSFTGFYIFVTINCNNQIRMLYRRAVLLVLPVLMFLSSCTLGEYDFVDNIEQSGQKPGPKPTPEITEEDYFVPVISIEVEDGRNIESKEEYLKVNVSIQETEDLVYSRSGRAKGRGNATWDSYEKKPYKLKFDDKLGILGFAANKEWVLLAEYCDKSLMRTAYMCGLAQTVGLPYPIHYRHVHLYLNGEYMGIYVLTDQVEKKSDRVDIEDDGFLFENDNYFWAEPLNFRTDLREYWYTFKYPDPEDGEIAEGDKSYRFITGFMNDFETALYGDSFKDPENGYRKYVDVQAFAKWFLVQELVANLEPNMYYVLPSRESKLQIGPVWDAEWSLGLAHREDEYAGWAGLPTQPERQKAIWSKWKYFGRMFEDEYFVDVVRAEWETLKPKLQAFQDEMKAVADRISKDQVKNFERWDILGWHVSVGLICMGTWEKEVEYVEQFFADRIEWLDAYLKEF